MEVEVAGAGDLDEGRAPVIGIEMGVRDQLRGEWERKMIGKWRHILRQDGGLVNNRSQPLGIIYCCPLRLIASGTVGGGVVGQRGHSRSRLISVSFSSLVGIRGRSLLIDTLYYGRRCFPVSAAISSDLSTHTLMYLSREIAQQSRWASFDDRANDLIRVPYDTGSRICALSANCCAASYMVSQNVRYIRPDDEGASRGRSL